MKCLIVDDAALMRNIIKRVLQQIDFNEFVEANNGLEAIRLYKRAMPDLVTMDITMPELNGIEAIIKIKEFDPRARIIVCSAMGHKETVLKAITAGARHYLVKPFENKKVIQVVKKVLESDDPNDLNMGKRA